MATFLVLIGLIAALAGLVLLLLAFVRRRPKRPAVLALVVGAGLLIAGGQINKNFPGQVAPPAQAQAESPKPIPVTETPAPVAAAPAPAPVAEVPTPEPVAETPAPEPVAEVPPADEVTSSGLTPVQNIAVIAGREPDDEEIAQHFEQLASVCPEQGSALADVVANAHGILKDKTGEEPDMIDLMQQLYDGQEGPAADGGMTCVESGGAVVTLMLNGQ